jgi:hypothetical protein
MANWNLVMAPDGTYSKKIYGMEVDAVSLHKTEQGVIKT